MITLKKNQIEGLLIQLSGITKEGKNVGLLHEKITLGTRRILKNILKDLIKEWQEYKKDRIEAQAAGEKEVEILDNEEISIDKQGVDMNILERIESEHNYDFDLLEKIAQ